MSNDDMTKEDEITKILWAALPALVRKLARDALEDVSERNEAIRMLVERGYLSTDQLALLLKNFMHYVCLMFTFGSRMLVG